MKKKIIIAVAAVLVCAAVFTAVIIIKHNSITADSGADGGEGNKSASEIIAAGKAEKNDTAADFDLKYPDRLAGRQASDVESNSSMIEVIYGDAGFVRKTYGVTENSGDDTEYAETQELVIDGEKVTLKGNGGKVDLAVWNSNAFAYTVSVEEGVTAEEMEEYVRATE